MEYLKPYMYLVGKERGTTNLLWGSLALASTSIIPIVGSVVVLGFQAEVAEDLKNDPELKDHRDFDPNKFVEYLTRGVWPFLIQFGVSMIVSGLVLFAILAGVLLGAALDEPVVGLIAAIVFIIPLIMMATMLLWPMELHAQLAKELKLGAAIRFTMAFFGKVGGQLFLTMFLHTLISVPMLTLGLMLCFVGAIPVAMILVMAQEHYMIQLYRIYLDEGGEPIGGPTEQLEEDEM